MRRRSDLQGILLVLLLSCVINPTYLIATATGSLVGVSDNSKSKFMDPIKLGSERPHFDDVGPRNITAVVGQEVHLRCKVKNPGERTVSWMRKRDLHILTSGIHTYTGDGRFSVRHPLNSDDWDLRIEYAQKRDAGVYECQVNTEPKINMAIMLNVEDAQATISGPSEVFVKKGSTISLTCTVNIQSTPPSSVLWYHGATVVDFDSPRGGISLETEKTETGTTSKLLVTKALIADSGNYTCMPSNASPASTVVHVLNGEHPAAMQTSRAGVRQHIFLLVSLSLFLLVEVR